MVRTGLAQHNDIEPSERLRVMPKALPNQALEAVSAHCRPGALLGNDQAKARMPQLVGANQNREESG